MSELEKVQRISFVLEAIRTSNLEDANFDLANVANDDRKELGYIIRASALLNEAIACWDLILRINEEVYQKGRSSGLQDLIDEGTRLIMGGEAVNEN